MSEKTIVRSIKDHIQRQGNDFKFIMGRTVLTKSAFLRRLDRDKKFRKMVVGLVVDLSVEILSRKPE